MLIYLPLFPPSICTSAFIFFFVYLGHICSYREWCSEAYAHIGYMHIKLLFSRSLATHILLSKLVLATCSFVTHRCPSIRGRSHPRSVASASQRRHNSDQAGCLSNIYLIYVAVN